MGAFPRARAMTVGSRKGATKSAPERVDRPVVVTTDGGAFVGGEGIPALVEDVDAAATVTASVATTRLAKVVEESHDSDTVDRERARVGEHVVVHFDGVGGEPAVLLVMAVAAALEEGRVLDVVNDGVRAGTSEGANGVDDSLFRIGDVHHIVNKYRHCMKIFHAILCRIS